MTPLLEIGLGGIFRKGEEAAKAEEECVGIVSGPEHSATPSV